jgi:hypothetical protein
VRDYLLSPVHPVGRHKAQVFTALGYTQTAWHELQKDLLAIAQEGFVRPGQVSPFGQKFEVSGSLLGPNGRSIRLTTVRILRGSDSAPRLVTAFPG